MRVYFANDINDINAINAANDISPIDMIGVGSVPVRRLRIGLNCPPCSEPGSWRSIVKVVGSLMGYGLMISTFFVVSLLAQSLTPAVIEHAQAGAAALDQGKFAVAIEEFKKVTELQPNSAPGFVNLGDAYFRNGDYQLAIPPLETGLRLKPDLMGAHQTLGVALLLIGNAAAAIPHLEKSPSPELLGRAYLEAGKPIEAMGAWQRVLNEHPDDPNALYYFSRATALASKQAADRLIALDRNSARAHQVTADRDVDLGRLADAQKEYAESLRLKPDAPGVHLAYGKALASTGNLSAAVPEFQAESKLRPADADAFYYLGLALLQHGIAADALDTLSHCDELAPNVPATLLALGRAAALAGDATRAEKSLTKVLTIVTEGNLALQAHYELAGLYRKSGKDTDADREMAEYNRLKGGGK